MAAEPADEAAVDERIVLAALWAALLFLYAYVDIFGFFRADLLAEAMAGRVGPFQAGQGFFLFTLAYVLPAIAMVPASLMVRRRVGRWLHPTLAGAYALTIVAAMWGEVWIYFRAGSLLEIGLLALIGWRARRRL